MASSNSIVRKLRDQHGWTAAELSKRSGVTQPMISLVERGFWGSAKVRSALASAFKVSVREAFPNVPAKELKKAGQAE